MADKAAFEIRAPATGRSPARLIVDATDGKR
jgi:hypothetical protein